MREVIEGKLYNTETAEEIAEWSNSYGRSDDHNSYAATAERR